MSNTFHPTVPENRIQLLDVLRGLAIAGVLISNILFFSGYIYTPFADLENMHLAKLNDILNMIIIFIIKGKFYPILMILFGAGLFMQFQKSQQPGFLKFFGWRMFLLLIIGMFHQTFWVGDVVTVYALFAFVLIPVRNLKPKSYLIIAASMFVLHFVVAFVQARLFTPASAHHAEYLAPLQLPGVQPKDLINTVQNDGFAGFQFLCGKHFDALWNIPRYIRITPSAILLFLLGGYLYGSGFITEKAHKLKYLLIFLGIGIIGSYLMFYVDYTYSIIGNFFMALSYISLIALLMKKGKAKKAFNALAPLGRMALTNYIMQSVIGIAIFYGIGLGYYGKLPLYQVLLIGTLILIFQIVFSKFWLQKYRFGPLEMIWRRLSYGKFINNKQSTPQPTNAVR